MQGIVLSNDLLVTVHRFLNVALARRVLPRWRCQVGDADSCAESRVETHANDSVLCTLADFLEIVSEFLNQGVQNVVRVYVEISLLGHGHPHIR